MSLMKSFIQNFKIFKAKSPPLIYVKSAWNFDYTCIYFLVLLYLFLLSKFWMFIYYKQLYISLEERFCDEVLLPLLESVMLYLCLAARHPSNVSIIIILSSECTCFISVKYNEPTSFSIVLFSYCWQSTLNSSQYEEGADTHPGRWSGSVIDLTLTSQHRHSRLPYSSRRPRIFWFNREQQQHGIQHWEIFQADLLADSSWRQGVFILNHDEQCYAWFINVINWSLNDKWWSHRCSKGFTVYFSKNIPLRFIYLFLVYRAITNSA